MDNDASDAERMAFEKIEAENQRVLDEQEREIAAAKGEGRSGMFDGSDAHVPLNWTVAEENRSIKLAEQVRERFPDFDEVFEDYALPTIRRNTRLFRRLLEQKNPPLEAYALGLRMRQEEAAKWKAQEHHPARTLTQQEIDSLDGEQFEEALRAGPEASSAEDEEYVTKEEMRQMNELNPESFAVCLDWIKRNRGR